MGSQLMDCPLAQLPIAAIDFESAGAAPGETDQPVQVGIVRVDNLFSAEETFTSYIACHRPVRWSASKVHGITTDMLLEAPTLTELWCELRRLLSGCVVLGHNPATEKRFLQAFPGHGFGPWLDTLALSRKAIPSLRDHSLGSVCEALGVTAEIDALVPGKRWHDALYDAAGSLAVLRALVRGLNMENAPLCSIDFAVS
ncbi:MAG: 3'-5' exonuclease [Akkermansia sp.]|nr:3'-5' exonuclease [Akkermansia sp.]